MVARTRSFAAALCGLAVADAALFRQSPLLMTHDSATGYIGVNDLEKPIAMCQTVSLVDQLSCGARALDMRLFQAAHSTLGIGSTRRRTIKYHHGKTPSWTSQQSLDSTLQGLVDWAGSHPTELVTLLLSHAYHTDSVGALAGDGNMIHDATLMGEIRSNFEKFGVRWEFDCAKISSWTLDEAKAAATMNNGGMMIVLDEQNCMDSMYDSSIDSRDKVRGYVVQHMAQGLQSSRPFTIQSLIQQAHIKVPLDADLNHNILQWVGEGLYSGVNLLEVNTICAYGTDISSQLGATVSQGDVSSCRAACASGCRKYGALPGCGFRSLHDESMANSTQLAWFQEPPAVV